MDVLEFGKPQHNQKGGFPKMQTRSHMGPGAREAGGFGMCLVRMFVFMVSRSPSSALLPFVGGGETPTKIDYSKREPLFEPLYWRT